MKKIFENEILSDEQLEKVSGGGFSDTVRDGVQLYLHGKISIDEIYDNANITKILHGMGYTGYQQTDLTKDNVYTDKSGNVLSGPAFWKKFGADNGISISKEREHIINERGLSGFANISEY